MPKSKLRIGKKYRPIHRDFISKKLIKSRKDWTYGGTVHGGIINVKYYIFYTQKTQKLIPEYLFEGIDEKRS